MERPAREKVEILLRFEEGTAGSLMTTDTLSLGEKETIGRAVEMFKATDLPLDSASYLYVTDGEGRLQGVLTLRHLFLNDAATPVRELMNPHVVSVSSETDVDEVLDLFRKYKFMALPVVDAERRLCGLITLKDILGRE
jgi:magnesium transporter